ncbi:MAG: beta-mannosidase [Flavobacteriaceae bacterium]|jgi:beta-mannosidase
MKFYIALIALIMTLNSFSQTMAPRVLEWSYLHPIKKSWQELGQKGSVQEALIATGELPDPFYGTNEEKFGWIEEYVWEFKTLFFVSASELENEYIEIEFPSIDTYSKVYVNDSLLMETGNAFMPHRAQIKDYLISGLNEIHVFITPPVIYHKDTYKDMGYQLPAPNDVHEIAIAPLTRKPQYQFGWDWALRMNTIGFNKAVNIYNYDVNRIINSSVNTVMVSENGVADIDLSIDFAVKSNDEVLWKSEVFGEAIVMITDGKGIRHEKMEQPKLWWPRGQGEPNLYEENWQFESLSKEIDAKSFKFGVKTSELIQEEDEWGTSYFFKINGRTIFSKGGDYIPQDIFPARVTDESIVDLVTIMAETNYNMVRVWGGGYYPDEIFFETCDELGLMVWQDLMFACAMYPGDDAFIANIKEEFEYQVPRIAAHASVVQFNGNNEVEVAWGNWGFQIKYGLFGKSAKEIEAAYDRIFKKTAPDVIRETTSIPYIHTSPLSNWGKTELYNHGSQHYWGVWHGNDPIEDFGKKIGRFNAEYGFQSFPEYSTINTFAEEKDWDLSSEVMKHHQKSYVGNDMILKHAKKLYGKPVDFEEFIYFSQLTQAKAVSMAVAGHRIDFPRCGGTLYWQVNDCWPAPTWSSIDYFGNWKALQYQMREDFEAVSIVANYNSLTDIDYYITSDVIDTFMCTIQCEVYDLEGKLLTSVDLGTMLNGHESKKMCVKPLKEELAQTNCHIIFTYLDQNGFKQKRTFDHLPGERSSANQGSVKVSIEVDPANLKQAVLTITNQEFIKDLWITVEELSTHLDENFKSLLPGTHSFTVEFDQPIESEIKPSQIKLKWL